MEDERQIRYYSGNNINYYDEKDTYLLYAIPYSLDCLAIL